MNRGMKLWGWPMVVGTVTGAGLVAALLGDGAWDYWSWLTLGGVSSAHLILESVNRVVSACCALWLPEKFNPD